MLKSYEITLEGDKIKCLGEKPQAKITQAILIVEETKEVTSIIAPHKPSNTEYLKEKIKISEDVVNPIVENEIQTNIRSHESFLRGYAPEDEVLYDDY